MGDHPDYTDWCGKTQLNGGGGSRSFHGLGSRPSEKQRGNWVHPFISCPLPWLPQKWWTVPVLKQNFSPSVNFVRVFYQSNRRETKTTRLSLAPFSLQTAAPNVSVILQMSQFTSKSTYSQNLSQYPFDWMLSPWSPSWVQHHIALISMSQCALLDWRCSLAGEQLPSTYSSGCNLQCTQRKNNSFKFFQD